MHLILFYLIYLLAGRHVRVFRPQGMSRMSSTRRAHLTTGVQGGRSGPPAPHPLLTSLAAQPASGDANILTSGECELLRRDAKVRADAGLLAWHCTRTASSTSIIMAAPRVMSGVHASAYSALAGLARAGVWRDALLRRRRWPSSGWRHLQGAAPSPRPRGRGARHSLRTAARCRSPPICSERLETCEVEPEAGR